MGRRKIDEGRNKSTPGSVHPTEKSSLPVICEQVRRYRTRRKIDQKELARQLNITANAVSNWEQGRSRPDVSLIPDLCRVLGISIYELYKEKDPHSFTEREDRHIQNYL